MTCGSAEFVLSTGKGVGCTVDVSGWLTVGAGGVDGTDIWKIDETSMFSTESIG